MENCYKRRDLLAEATGPTEEEYAAQGVTFLVGTLGSLAFRPGLPSTPLDGQLSQFARGSVDTLPVLVGELGALFQREQKDATWLEIQAQKTQRKMGEKLARKAAAANAAAAVLTRWFASNEGDFVEDYRGNPITWVAKDKGYGFLFEGDDFVVRHVTDKARSIAKDPRYSVHFTVVPTTQPEQYLVAFVADPKFVPLTYENAINLAEAVVSDPTAVEISEEETDAINFKPPPGVSGVEVGNFFKKAFGPKKPEGIKKRIEKLKKELEELEEKLKEAESKSSGFSVGYVPTYANRQVGKYSTIALLSAMGNNPGSSSYYGPVLVDRLSGLTDDESLYRGDLLSPGGDADDLDDGYSFGRGLVRGDLLLAGYDDEGGRLDDEALYDGTLLSEGYDDEGGALDDDALYRGDLLTAAVEGYDALVEAGAMSEHEAAALEAEAGELDVGELEAEVEGLMDAVGELVESGALMPTSFFPSLSSSSSSSGGKKGKKAKRKARRLARRKAAKKAARKAARKAAKAAKRGGGSQPQIIVLQQPQAKRDDDEDDEDDDDDVDGLTHVGTLGPNWNPGGGVVDVPAWNPMGATVNYPVGAMDDEGGGYDDYGSAGLMR